MYAPGADSLMDLNRQKEQFSIAYLRAVAARAGFSTSPREVDVDSVDYSLNADDGLNLSMRPQVEVQLKCTSEDIVRPDTLHFRLSLKNYDELRIQTLVPRILVVVLVPFDVTEWLVQSEHELVMRRCGYWMSLRDWPTTANETSVTVEIPREQVFTPHALTNIMSRINQDGRL
jgi:hypothetical protein